jgi:ABC-2 type transport system permease protein
MTNSYISVISPFSKIMVASTRQAVTFVWIMVPSCALFYLLYIPLPNRLFLPGTATSLTDWLYAGLALSIALFGFASSQVKRQESHIVRCFLYTRRSKMLFICRLFFAYSIISIALCLAFYLATQWHCGNCQFQDLIGTALRFYLCYVLFCGFGLLLTCLPVRFQSFRELIILAAFSMLATEVLAEIRPGEVTAAINLVNPLSLARQIMTGGLEQNALIARFIILFFLGMLAAAVKYAGVGTIQDRY